LRLNFAQNLGGLDESIPSHVVRGLKLSLHPVNDFLGSKLEDSMQESSTVFDEFDLRSRGSSHWHGSPPARAPVRGQIELARGSARLG
jgi:hypothetical protein